MGMFFLGVLRGADLQAFGAFAMFISFYFCGIPLSAYLGLQEGVGLPGVWYGNVVGMSLSAVAMGMRLYFINWSSIAETAKGPNEPRLAGTPKRSTGATLLEGTDSVTLAK